MTVADQKPPEETKAFACPKCGCKHLPVLYTRKARWGKREIVRRRRECRQCGHRVTSSEIIGGF